ncbi:MAG: SprB repeat-containing protein, partial [Bacteroidota bacterium]
GGTAPFTFLWSNAETTQDIFNLPAGTYSCEITDNNECSINTGNLYVINNPGTLQMDNVTKTDEICGNNQGSINLTVSGGTTPYTFLWNTGATSEDLLNISAGNYSCTITDQNGCQLTVNKTIINNQGTLSLLNTVISNETCGNSNGQIDNIISGGNPPLNYLWSSGHTTEDISGIVAGSYSCTITDVNGCQLFSSSIVDNNTATLSITNVIITNEVCSDSQGSINLTVSGTQTPISFNWSSGQSTEDLTYIQAGTFTCTITDNSGCVLIGGPYVINNSAPGLFINNVIVVDENCGDASGSVNITVTGGSGSYTYLWSNSSTTEDISNLSAGSYTITVTDANSCAITTNAIVDNNSGTLILNNYLLTNEVCSNSAGAINITVSGGTIPITYNWSNSATSEDISGLSGGIYSVTIIDNTGCSITSNNYTISNSPGTFSLDNISVTDEVCGDATGAIDITVSGGLVPISYIWNTGAITSDIINLNSGLYSCTATDNNGCKLIFSENVYNNPGNLAVNSTVVTDETCHDSNGQIDITIFGGTSPFIFSWNNGSNTEDLINISSGNYVVVITDDNGCTITHNAFVNNIGGNLLVSNVSTINEYCGNNDGAIDITITGGISPYTYIWSSGQTTQDIYFLSQGTYSCSVTDNIGCFTQTSVTISSNIGTLSIDDISIIDEYCGDGAGEIDLTYSGGTEPVVITWNTGSNDEDLEDLTNGTYFVTIVDAYGCNVIDTAAVLNETNGFVINNSAVTDENCGNGLGNIDLTLTGGYLPYTYIWSNGASTEDISNLSEGIYTCSITDNIGCMLTIAEQIINVTNGLELQSSTTGNDYCNSSTGSINQTINGGSTPYSFIWSSGATSEDLIDVVAGSYNATITDNTGCMIYSQYVIDNDINNNLGFNSIAITDDACGQGNGIIDFQPAVPGSYTYEINGVANGSPITQFTNLYEGTYIISIVDLGCRVDSIVTVENTVTFSVNIDNIINEDCGNGDGAVYLSIVPGTGVYTYNWSNNTYNANLLNVNAGSYTCDISDNLGCHDIITVDVLNNATFTATANTTEESCGNSSGSIDITVSGTTGTVTYTWNTGDYTQDLTGLSAGQYSCTITDDNCAVVVNQEVTNNTGTFSVISTVVNDFCNQSQGYIALSMVGGSGNYSILWNTSATVDTLYNLNTGQYSVTVTDNATSCIYTENYTIGNIGYFAVTDAITNSGCQTCNNGAINLTINGGSPNYYFAWNNAATTEDISGLLPGSYTVTINDDWGCESVETYIIGYLDNLLSLSSVFGNDSCNMNIGFIEVTVIGGSGDYSYLWSNSDTTQNLYDLASGSYNVTITDNISTYNIYGSYSIINYGSYSVSSGITNASCQTCNDGAVNLTLAGSSNYSFIWSNGAISEDITGLLPGIYTVTIADITGCENVESYEISYHSCLFSIT